MLLQVNTIQVAQCEKQHKQDEVEVADERQQLKYGLTLLVLLQKVLGSLQKNTTNYSLLKTLQAEEVASLRKLSNQVYKM